MQCWKKNEKIHIKGLFIIGILDIDECATGTQSCSADAVCYNAEGSYNCSCKPGYSGDGWYCKGSEMKKCMLNLGLHKLWYSVLSMQC